MTEQEKKKKGHIAWVEKEVLEYAFPVEQTTVQWGSSRGWAGLKQRWWRAGESWDRDQEETKLERR